MTTLAEIVQDQDVMIDDISTNVDQANFDMRAGYRELERYYQSISGNRRLVLRLFFVLVSFLTFFLLFLA